MCVRAHHAAAARRSCFAHRARPEVAGDAGSAPAPRPVVVSIFVNPTQFNDPGDLRRYPRTLDADAELCRRGGADAVGADAEDIYPPGETVAVPPLPPVATEPGLEGVRMRPGHFAGVCQVVARLFSLLRPSRAVFGEKDWQQLQVIRAMVGSTAAPRAERSRYSGADAA